MVGPIGRKKQATIKAHLSAHESGRGGARELVICLPWKDEEGKISSGEMKLKVKGNFGPTSEEARMTIVRTMEFALAKFIEALHPEAEITVVKRIDPSEIA